MNGSRRNRKNLGSILLGAAVAVLAGSGAGALTGHFNGTQDPNYNFSIYGGPMNEAVGAWTLSGHLLTRSNGLINEYDPTATSVHQGTTVHNILAPHNVTGLASGFGMTNGTDGFIYTVGSTGIQRVNPNNWAAPAVNMPNTISSAGYGINTLPNGNLVYSDGVPGSKVYVYNPVTQVNTLIHTSAGSTNVDDIETGPGGEIALAEQNSMSIRIVSSSGSLIKQFSTTHPPDGLAFGAGSFGNSVYANNNDGSLTRYDFGSPNYQGTVTPVDIGTSLPGNRGYGDLATVGPDCAFYIGTFVNTPAYGNSAGIGTNWDNGVSNSENSIVRIGFNDRNGLPSSQCAFYSLVETLVPEPTSLSLAALAVGALLRRNRRV